MTTWIIGCGNIGKRVALCLKEEKYNAPSIRATSHSFASISTLEKMGINVSNANLDNAESLNNLNTENSKIFYFAPPSTSPPSLSEDIRMSNFVRHLSSRETPKRIVYISTTGVYGDHNGEWITENTPTNPHAARSKRRLSAENKIKQYCKTTGCEYMILRVAGIYDLDKLPLQRINNGLKILHREIAPASNRIHAADLAKVCIAAMNFPQGNKIFNVADGNPSSISDYFIQIAEVFNLTPPKEINWETAQKELSAGMLSYLSESKKIDVTHTLKQLNINLSYPTLKQGLINCKKEYDLLITN